MNNKKSILFLFLVICIIQILVIGKMVFTSENILKEGKEYKFKTAPVDPSDPFRGKYIVLRFEQNNFSIDSTEVWSKGEEAFVILKKDSSGFATIHDVLKKAPDDTNYVKAEVQNAYSNRIIIKYPFTRFYMEESKAYPAELAYRRSQRDSTSTTYASVYIKNGNAILNDVLVDGISISELAVESQ